MINVSTHCCCLLRINTIRPCAHTGAHSCSDMVVSIWSSCLQQCVLGCQEHGQPLPPDVPRELPVGLLQLAEVVEMLQVNVNASLHHHLY